VVVATGGYHRPKRHPLAHSLPAAVLQRDSSAYSNQGQLPAGPVLGLGCGNHLAVAIKPGQTELQDGLGLQRDLLLVNGAGIEISNNVKLG